MEHSRGNCRRPLALIVWLAVGLVAVAAVASCGSNVSTPSAAATPTASPTVPPTASPSPEPPGPFWVIGAASYQGVPPDLIAAIKALPVRPSTGTLFAVNSLFVANDWAIAWAGVAPFPSAAASPTETAVVIGHLVGDSWVLTTDRDPGFCSVLAQAPPVIANDE
jgi:hypothetical protein